MAPRLGIYDFDQVSVIFGPVVLEGFQDGEGVTIEPGAETFTMVVGADGHVARSKTLNKTATVTIKLLQTSACNDLLSALHNLDRDTPNGAGVVPLTIRDRNGRSLYFAPQAWISDAPDVTFDREATAREWTVSCAFLARTDGGS